MRVSYIDALGLFFLTAMWLISDHYPPWLSFHSETLAFAGLCCVFASTLLRQGQFVAVPRAGLWIAFAILIPWFQYAGGVIRYADDALLVSLYLLGLLAAVLVGFYLGGLENERSKANLMKLMHCIWIAAVASAMMGIAQWLGVETSLDLYIVQTAIGSRAVGNLAQANHLATLLLIGMVAFSYVFERRVVGRYTYALGIGLMTCALILTQSRAGMLSLISVAAFLTWKMHARESCLSAWVFAGWAACFLIGIFLLPYVNEVLLLSAPRSIGDAAPVSYRLQMWQQVIHAVSQSPWVGYGWNQTPQAYAVGATTYPGEAIYTNAHNFVLDILAWNGVLLGTILLVVIAYWFITRMRSVTESSAIYAMACLLPFAIHSMLEFPFAYAYFLIVAGLMMGVVEAEQGYPRKILVNARWGWSILVLSVLLGCRLIYEYFLIEEDFREVRLQSVHIGKVHDAYQSPNILLITHMAGMLKAARQTVEPGMRKVDIENLRDVSSRFVYAAPRFYYALALALNGDASGASHQMVIIRGMYGESYYAACKAEIRRLQSQKYPQLVEVIMP